MCTVEVSAGGNAFRAKKGGSVLNRCLENCKEYIKKKKIHSNKRNEIKTHQKLHLNVITTSVASAAAAVVNNVISADYPFTRTEKKSTHTHSCEALGT